jgi:enoyl-[acyl-carrier protein] reductase II
MANNSIVQLFNIDYPIIQAGMIWCSGWRLAAAVSNAGGLGLIGAGSMYPDVLASHIIKCQQATQKPFGVNLPLLYPDIDKHIALIIKHKVPIVFTSAGNPKTWTSILKSEGIKVVHVVSSAKFALKSEDAGVDAIVAEGFEAGGHNGREETTSMCLLPLVKKVIKIPLIAAGGIGSGSAMLAAMVLGANGVQVGSRFVASQESSANEAFKAAVIAVQEGDTQLALKKLTPVRLIKNQFFKDINQAELGGATAEQLDQLLGKARAKRGMFEGDMEQGELEIGQVAASFKSILPAAEIVATMWQEYLAAKQQVASY